MDLHPMNAWERYWFGPVAAIRPYFLMKGVLCLLAFDAWMLRVPRAGRYGDGGFNVAHFQWLDALQPLPSPDLYVGLMLSVGMLALVCALTGAGPSALALLALMWTYGWAMSMHDSYQHHYFLSLVLIAFVFLPRVHAHDVYPAGVAPRARRGRKAKPSSEGKQGASSWAYVLLGANVAIVYAFTALTKLDMEWRTGQVFRQLAGVKRVLGPIEAWFAGLGVSGEVFWGAVALSIFTAECLVAVGYLLAVRLDENPKRWLRMVTWLAFMVAVSFHVGAELFLRLRIGWFSYYMIVLACIYLLPQSFLSAVGTLVTWRVRLAARWSIASAASQRRTSSLHIAVTVIAVTAVGAVGFALDLPAAETVGLLIASVLVGATLLAFVLGRQRDGMRYVLATALAGGIMWTVIGQSTVRFQYYGLIGDQWQRRGNLVAALEAYERATRYAPDKERTRLEQLVDGLRRRRGRSAD